MLFNHAALGAFMKKVTVAFLMLAFVAPLYAQSKTGHANASAARANTSAAQPQSAGALQNTASGNAVVHGTATQGNATPTQKKYTPGQVCKVQKGQTYHCL